MRSFTWMHSLEVRFPLALVARPSIPSHRPDPTRLGHRSGIRQAQTSAICLSRCSRCRARREQSSPYSVQVVRSWETRERSSCLGAPPDLRRLQLQGYDFLIGLNQNEAFTFL